MTLSLFTAWFAYLSGAVSAVLLGLLAWQWGVSTMQMFRRRKPSETYEEMRERALEPIPDGPPPRCYVCRREFIWPDHEPVPPRQRCLECLYRFRDRLFRWALSLAVVAAVAWMLAQ